MKKHYWYIAPALIISLFIYLFYRTDKTLVNQIFIQFSSLKTYEDLKYSITTTLPLNKYIIYSLPEGLWVFCITLTSKGFYIKFFNRQIDCVLIPPAFAIGLELFQLLHITNGRFDILDIAISLLFWFLALKITQTKARLENVFNAFNLNSAVCLLSYCIVYLAHVNS
ncbi:hypothetical protein OC25_19420 [Pedobacter kyungheensis]|uniref:Uncharacterized protein n=1 Tax=Pedobacter kyungheensis TaxID=1069985 RepID=A0A0C1FFX7_9SPHI|nr:hypothetical protein [Pedobacter kyungheensis]KIA91947.1 hypothetical protein OC25_19420 [Pedobacter kyungheensis]